MNSHLILPLKEDVKHLEQCQQRIIDAEDIERILNIYRFNSNYIVRDLTTVQLYDIADYYRKNFNEKDNKDLKIFQYLLDAETIKEKRV